MKIRQAHINDIDEIMDVLFSAKEFMKRNGNHVQWNNDYPQRKLMLEEIDLLHCWVCVENDDIVGTFCYIEGIEPTYANIENGKWLNTEPYATIHRVASNGKIKGILDICLNWSKQRIDNIRIDTHELNTLMQRKIIENKFINCGTIYVEDGSPRLAFQWNRANK